MGAREYWFEVTDNGILLRVSENDGPVYLRKGPEREEEFVNYDRYKDDIRVKKVISDWESRTGRKFSPYNML